RVWRRSGRTCWPCGGPPALTAIAMRRSMPSASTDWLSTPAHGIRRSRWEREDEIITRSRRDCVEADPLRQGQGVAPVDRAGLPPQGGLPRVGARFPPAARRLLAAEGAADLGSRGADVDVRDAAVGALCREEPLRFAQALGEDRRGQALLDRVVHGEGFVER